MFRTNVVVETNLARGAQSMASSSYNAIGWTPRLVANDGQRPSTLSAMGWSSDSALQVNHPEYYQLDLGAVRDVRSVVLFPRTDAGNVGQGFPVDFSIQVSIDGLLWTTVLTRTDHRVPNVGEAFTFGPRSARHVRVDMTGLRGSNPNDPTYRAQLAEVEVY